MCSVPRVKSHAPPSTSPLRKRSHPTAPLASALPSNRAPCHRPPIQPTPLASSPSHTNRTLPSVVLSLALPSKRASGLVAPCAVRADHRRFDAHPRPILPAAARAAARLVRRAPPRADPPTSGSVDPPTSALWWPSLRRGGPTTPPTSAPWWAHDPSHLCTVVAPRPLPPVSGGRTPTPRPLFAASLDAPPNHHAASPARAAAGALLRVAHPRDRDAVLPPLPPPARL
eukprot:4031725-Prymnesium_polylepis.1